LTPHIIRRTQFTEEDLRSFSVGGETSPLIFEVPAIPPIATPPPRLSEPPRVEPIRPPSPGPSPSPIGELSAGSRTHHALHTRAFDTRAPGPRPSRRQR